MATIGSGSPLLYVEGSAQQIGASGNQRTVRITARFRVNGNTNPSYASWYGYPCNWRARVHNSYGGWAHMKGTESWKSSDGLRTFTQDITVDVGTSSAVNITVGIEANHPSYSSWNGGHYWTFGVGSTNTAPWMNGAVTIRAWDANGPVLNGYYPENVSTLHLSWPAGGDNEQGSNGLKYGVNQIVNGGGATTILYPTTSTSCTAGIGAGGEGQRLKYYVDCRDNSDVLSGNRADSPEIVKNTLTPAGFTGHSNNIAFDSPSFTLYYGGAKNTDGSGCNFLIYSDTVTIHNGSASTSGTQAVTIWRSGATPSGPYIKFDDLKNKFAGSNYAGTIHVGLRTGNNYGTYKYAGGAVSVDLRIAPNPATGQEISTDASLSTIYKKVAFANNYYFLPDGSAHCRVHWNDGSGKLGEAVSYEIFVAYGSGSWQKVADKAATGGYNYINHTIPKQSVSQQFKYLIRTKTSYGYYSDAVTSAQTLHYYNAPSITVGQINRTETAATIPVTVSTASSIPNISTVGNYTNTTLGGGSVNLSPTQVSQNLNFSGLTGNGTYTARVTYNDNTGFASNQTRDIAIGANLPVMFVNKYGLGVGGSKADSSYNLKVDGSTYISSNLNVGGTITPNNLIIPFKDTRNENNKPEQELPTPRARFDFRTNGSIGLSDGGLYAGVMSFRSYGSDTDWSGGPAHQFAFTHNGQLWMRSGTTAWNGWNKFYTTGNKPTPAEIGALSTSGGNVTGKTTITCNGAAGYTGGSLEVAAASSSGLSKLVLHSPGLTAPALEAGNDGDNLTAAIERNGVIKIKNQNGSVMIGPINDGFCHHNTDRPNHYFNTNTRVAGLVYSGPEYGWRNIHSSHNSVHNFNKANNGKHYIHCDTNEGAWGIDIWASDVKLKSNIVELTGKTNYLETIDKKKLAATRPLKEDSALDVINKIEHYSFNTLVENQDNNSVDCGYIANQLETINKDFVMEVEQPEKVQVYDEETEEMIEVDNPQYFEDEPTIKNPRVSALLPYITKAMQEQQLIIEKLTKRIEELEAKCI